MNGEHQVYEFVPTGENTCERCAALAGSEWREPPSPPHAHCECEVRPRMVGLHHISRDCGDNSWSTEPLQNGTVRYGPGGLDGFEWGFRVTIDCWDGGVYEFELWVDMGSDDDYPEDFDVMEAFAWSQMHDEVEAVAARVCRPCEPPLVS